MWPPTATRSPRSRVRGLSGDRVIDAEGKYVLPGAIDPHTHHGIYRGLEADAETESRPDLVGGVTTIGNYFRRGGSYEEIMEGYFAEAEPNYYHDYFFSLGLLSFEHIEEIPYIVEELGITSFKWYKNYKDVAPEKFGTDSDARRRLGGRVHSGARRRTCPRRSATTREHGDHERARRQPVPRLPRSTRTRSTATTTCWSTSSRTTRRRRA